ncbi:MAG: TolC family outer membrane protein [Pseudomonas sp.]|uniref:TolC family outer membrane protein n=1 Tax=Pseudomonas sp. TaxID=306 RepID=UPI002736010F|nr:TolC family outer membrane protein [Pseudomonas sp.]MDP3847828.1 TolC family outer membrane protein [Pseudomonas sp.]
MRAIALLIVALSALSAQAQVAPVSLLNAYDSSLLNDPAYQAATFDYRSSQQEAGIGIAGLLPQISASSRVGETKQLREQVRSTFNNTGDASAANGSVALTARQALFDKAKMAFYEQSKAREKAGSALYDDASQELFARVAEAYFDVARQDNELKLATQQKAAIEGLVKQTRRLLEAGDGTITDTEEALARLDLVKAQEIEFQAKMRAALHKLSGRAGLVVEQISSLQDNLPTAAMLQAPENLLYWQQKALQAAPKLGERRASIEVAEAELKLQKAGNYPTLSFVSEISTLAQDSQDPNVQHQSSYYVGLSMELPIYSGGGVTASINKSQYALSGAMAQYDSGAQQISEDIERDYLGVVSGYDKCKALQTAVKSNQRALDSAEKGYQAGVRSTVDILNAQQVLYAAKRDLLNSKLFMLQSYVSLHVQTGQMHRGVLEKVQSLF